MTTFQFRAFSLIVMMLKLVLVSVITRREYEKFAKLVDDEMSYISVGCFGVDVNEKKAE